MLPTKLTSMIISCHNTNFALKVRLTLSGRNVSVIYDSVHTAQYTLSTLVIKPNLLTMYKAKVTVCSDIHTKYINLV